MSNIYSVFFIVLNLHLNIIRSYDLNEQKCLYNNLDNNTRINNLPGANMTSLTIEANDYSNAEFKFGSSNNFFSILSRGKYKDLFLSYVQTPILSVNNRNDMMIFPKVININKGLTFTGDFKVRGVNQWKLVHEEDFSLEATGWTNNTVTECGGVRMLGGYCQFSKGEVFKTFENIPKHRSVRIQATYHFIDAWDTESGYMLVDNGKQGEMQYAWIERYSAFMGENGINVCGGQWPEGKFSSPIDVTIPHTESSIKIGFGSTLEQDACDESFGISGLRIFIR